jgi:hypothetical protein
MDMRNPMKFGLAVSLCYVMRSLLGQCSRRSNSPHGLESILRLTRRPAWDVRIPGLFQPSSQGIGNMMRRSDLETGGRRQKA